MLFELSNDSTSRSTHAGVLEFIADEGKAYVPQWMMQTLLLNEGDIIRIKSVSLQLGTFVKIQPQSVDFLDITDPKAVLENALRNFSTLTEGDIITIQYNKKLYDILVMETKPAKKGISIIETDLEVDFAPPLGYVEPTRGIPIKGDRGGSTGRATPTEIGSVGSVSSIEEHMREHDMGFVPFKGSGMKLSGKGTPSSPGSGGGKLGVGTGGKGKGISSPLASGRSVSASESVDSINGKSPIPAALHLPPGKLFFGYPTKPPPSKQGKENGDDDQGGPPKFQGQGQTLRAARRGGGSSSGSSSSLGGSSSNL
ncbi:ubiquitin fusion degradation protein [Quaeritorhiza haematococci]|nr:ubiquitin fusion degradation protein [Quaeritorhiza haematococci]